MITVYDTKAKQVYKLENKSRFFARENKDGTVDICISGTKESFGRFNKDMFGSNNVKITPSDISDSVKEINASLDDWLSKSQDAVCFLPDDVISNINWQALSANMDVQQEAGLEQVSARFDEGLVRRIDDDNADDVE